LPRITLLAALPDATLRELEHAVSIRKPMSRRRIGSSFVLDQYAQLQRYLLDMSDTKENGESGDASPSPSGASPQAAPTGSPTPSVSPMPTATP
jgi:hypothetical protein